MELTRWFYQSCADVILVVMVAHMLWQNLIADYCVLINESYDGQDLPVEISWVEHMSSA